MRSFRNISAFLCGKCLAAFGLVIIAHFASASADEAVDPISGRLATSATDVVAPGGAVLLPVQRSLGGGGSGPAGAERLERAGRSAAAGVERRERDARARNPRARAQAMLRSICLASATSLDRSPFTAPLAVPFGLRYRKMISR